MYSNIYKNIIYWTTKPSSTIMGLSKLSSPNRHKPIYYNRVKIPDPVWYILTRNRSTNLEIGGNWILSTIQSLPISSSSSSQRVNGGFVLTHELHLLHLTIQISNQTYSATKSHSSFSNNLPKAKKWSRHRINVGRRVFFYRFFNFLWARLCDMSLACLLEHALLQFWIQRASVCWR